ncbi:hypothetical protein SAMN04487944_11397 [Gracilibacillus ureilyticus]|uniref:Uncharacterized protein n=1 Tax=Gracilibacillus ureilyticus TaxID=531814 RepID=A0A1H9TBT8_9BACI|nr:hypothetical protein [Gracilibacillus ureilyticus]SER94705.1 hypothetical protein SAMN04487944_11397 [Gracilibacillus ureilyticus]
MIIYILLILILGIISFVLTYRELGRSDPNYREKSRSHLKFLSLIYFVAIVGSIIALITYTIST